MLYLLSISDLICYTTESFKSGIWIRCGWHRRAKTCGSGEWLCF